MITLYVHIVATLSSMMIGYYVFLYTKSNTRSVVLNTISFTLIVSAITGVLLNLRYFSPFHILSIVVLTTIPMGLYNYYLRDDYKNYYNQVWFNFLGLNLAFVGAMYPDRYMGSRLWERLENVFNFTHDTSYTMFYILMSVSGAYVAYLYVKTIIEIRKSKINKI